MKKSQWKKISFYERMRALQKFMTYEEAANAYRDKWDRLSDSVKKDLEALDEFY
jgi:hypothetical protein